MQVQRVWRVFPAVVVALAGLVSSRTPAARAADLAQYISPDFCAVLVIHPQRIAESTLVEAIKSALPKEMTSDPAGMAKAALMKNLNGLPPDVDAEKLSKLVQDASVRRIVIAVEAMPAQAAAPGPSALPAGAALVVQFNNDIDGGSFFSALGPRMKDAEIGGVKCKTAASDNGEIAVVFPDSRTLIVGMKGTVAKMLAKNEGDRPFLLQLQRANFKHDILIEFCAEPMWEKVTQSTGKSIDQLLAPAGNAAYTDMAKDVKSLSLQLDFSGETLLHAVVTTGKPETAMQLAGLSQIGTAAAKQGFEAVKKQPAPIIPPALVPVLSKVGDEAFAGLKIKADGPQLTVEMAMPASLPDGLKTAVQSFLSLAMPAPAGK